MKRIKTVDDCPLGMSMSSKSCYEQANCAECGADTQLKSCEEQVKDMVKITPEEGIIIRNWFDYYFTNEETNECLPDNKIAKFNLDLIAKLIVGGKK